MENAASKRKYVSDTGPESHFETDGKDTGYDQKKVRMDKETREHVLMDRGESGGTSMEEKSEILSCDNSSHQKEVIVDQSDLCCVKTRKLFIAPGASCSSMKAYTNWDYETISFPSIMNRSELEIDAPEEHLLPSSVHLSKKKYRFSVQNMKNNTQIRSQDDDFKFSLSSTHWKASIKVVYNFFSSAFTVVINKSINSEYPITSAQQQSSDKLIVMLK